MSKENVEIVRRTFEAWIRGDLDATLALFHEEIEWDLSSYAGWPEEQLYRGRESLRSFWQRWRASWDDYEAGTEDLIDAADRVVALCWQRARGGESGAMVEMSWAQIYTVRDGKIVRVENYSDREEALEAAGVQE